MRRQFLVPLWIATIVHCMVVHRTTETRGTGVHALMIRSSHQWGTVTAGTCHSCWKRPRVAPLTSSSRLNSHNSHPDEQQRIESSESSNAWMRETSRLSHVALKVSSVEASVQAWTSKGGCLVDSQSNGKTNGEAELLHATVTMGPVPSSRKEDDEPNKKLHEASPWFALELSKALAPPTTPNNNGRKRGLSYLGLSMLLKFQDTNPLLELMKGNPSANEPPTTNKKETEDEKKIAESEDLVIKYVASAPGDGFAQLALVSDNKLVETCEFYTSVLGMDQKAQDQRLLCLRYDAPRPSATNSTTTTTMTTGVATTLVFENRSGKADGAEEQEEEDSSGCFDHLAIHTTSSIQALYQSILEGNDKSNSKTPVQVYMKPTLEAGANVLGLMDPNGYKVVVYGTNE